MSRWQVAWVTIVVTAVAVTALGGGLVADGLKSAARHEREGKPLAALEAYLRALRLEPGNTKARKGVERVAAAAIDGQLELAATLRGEQRWQEAIAELRKATTVVEEARSFGLPGGVGGGLREALDGTRLDWIGHLRGEAARATADGLWGAAVADLQQVEALQPGFEDTRDRLVVAWTGWGEADLAAARFRSAADRFTRAARVPGGDGAAAARRAARILSALGDAALRRGGCRQAVLDLRAASRLAPETVAAAQLQQAESCAVTCLAVNLVGDPETGIEAAQLERLAAVVRDRVAAGASEFLRLRPPGTAQRDECGGASAGPSPRILRAGVRVAALTAMREATQATTRSMRVQDEVRRTDTVIGYEEYEEPFTGVLAGWLSFSERGVEPVGRGIPVRATAATSARWARRPSALATSADRPAVLLVSPGEPGRAEVEAARREARARLQRALLESFAAEAARLILATADAEPPIPDPTELSLSASP